MKIGKTCPKCGHDDSVMTFLPKGTKYYSNDKDFKKLEEFLGVEKKDEYTTSSAKIVKECVKVHCRTCQYSWVSPTVEAPTNAFGMSDVQIKTAQDEIQKAVDDEIRSRKELDPFDPFMPMYKDAYIGDIPDWFNKNIGTCGDMFPNGSFDGWSKND